MIEDCKVLTMFDHKGFSFVTKEDLPIHNRLETALSQLIKDETSYKHPFQSREVSSPLETCSAKSLYSHSLPGFQKFFSCFCISTHRLLDLPRVLKCLNLPQLTRSSTSSSVSTCLSNIRHIPHALAMMVIVVKAVCFTVLSSTRLLEVSIVSDRGYFFGRFSQQHCVCVVFNKVTGSFCYV